ncbi:MAG: site-2 protease family protein [Blastocatellia bacterium]
MRLSGVPLVIDYRWPFIALAHVWLLAVVYLPAEMPYAWATPKWRIWVAAAVMTLLLFVSIIIHELAHAAAAKLEGIRTLEIRLHPFGGWAKLEAEPRRPLAEFRIVIMGPVSSFLLAVIFLSGRQISLSFLPRSSLIVQTFSYLFLGNLLLAMFNLLPGLPLDGGRALRAWLWHRKGNILEATRTATKLGVALAYMLMSFGIYRGVTGRDIFTCVGLLIFGWFLKTSAETDLNYRLRVRQWEQENGIVPEIGATAPVAKDWNVAGTVGAIMKHPVVSVAPGMRVTEFIDQILAENRVTCFPVARDGRLHGLLSLEKLRALPEDKWETTSIGEVMDPVNDTLFVTVRSSVEHATRKVGASPFRYLAVLDTDGRLVGSLSQAELPAK